MDPQTPPPQPPRKIVIPWARLVGAQAAALLAPAWTMIDRMKPTAQLKQAIAVANLTLAVEVRACYEGVEIILRPE